MNKITKSLDTQKAEKLLLSLLKNGPKDRKQLVAECLAHIDLSPEELKDTSPGAPLNRAKCTIGGALARLIRRGHLKQEENTIALVKSIEVAQKAIERDPLIKDIILQVVNQSQCTKNELLNKVVEKYHAEVNAKEKSATIRSDCGRILSDLLKTEEIQKKENYLVLQTKSERTRILFSRLSDEEFVNRSVELLERWYREKCPTLSVKGANTDGPNDGGIDGNIEVSDELWGSFRIVLQMKHINSSQKKYVPLCEIQEFCGVLSAEKNAQKGVFLTNAAYHAKAVQFVHNYTYKPLVLIDGEKWLALAESCGYTLPEPEI